ncbi:Cat eye syndrome critical region protein 6 [Orchesella cincta]|uniref:Cat eye syndrome critical region protein 6 n=1 Tax=Orchesella cincta TaxID=48709 RepID=A0A1D2MN70_ORCCI|nr:Cat eye syndrome critical region protein 6 [Orchesella cincta]
MLCKKSTLIRFADAVVLAVVFLFQNVLLNIYIIKHSSFSFLSFLWFLGDFFCLLFFSFTLFLAHQYHHKAKKRQRRSASRASFASGTRSATPQGSDTSEESGIANDFSRVLGHSKLPFSYVSWLFYSLMIILKIAVLFKSDVAQTLRDDEVFGPQLLKFCIGLSTIVFSLLVGAHHDAQSEPLRNAYLDSLAFSVALEILDSTSFLSLLMPTEGHLAYPYSLENIIIILASVNIMLPAVTIYKLTASNFGRVYNVPLETLYKVLHLILVNIPFLGVRLFLWNMFSTDTAIFMIKNIYAIIGFMRGFYGDLKLFRNFVRQRVQFHNAAVASQKLAVAGPSNGVTNGRHSGVVFQNEKFLPDKDTVAGVSPKATSNGNARSASVSIEIPQ